MRVSPRLKRLVPGVCRNLRYSNGWQVCFNRIFHNEARMEHYVWKGRFHFVADPGVNDQFSLHEIFIGRTYDAHLAKCARPGGRLKYVNIGANIGGFDVKVMEMGYRIHESVAVELNPSTFDRCKVNFRANGVSVTLVNAGIAGGDGSVDFSPAANSLADSIYRNLGRPAGGVAVRLLTLVTLLKEHPDDGSEFDLLKLDCEGAEYAILRHTPVPVLRRFRNILVEFHEDPPNASLDDACRKLEQAGFVGANRGQSGGAFVDLFVRSGGATPPGEGNPVGNLSS